MKVFKIPKVPSTTAKSIRFPNDIAVKIFDVIAAAVDVHVVLRAEPTGVLGAVYNGFGRYRLHGELRRSGRLLQTGRNITERIYPVAGAAGVCVAHTGEEIAEGLDGRRRLNCEVAHKEYHRRHGGDASEACGVVAENVDAGQINVVHEVDGETQGHNGDGSKEPRRFVGVLLEQEKQTGRKQHLKSGALALKGGRVLSVPEGQEAGAKGDDQPQRGGGGQENPVRDSLLRRAQIPAEEEGTQVAAVDFQLARKVESDQFVETLRQEGGGYGLEGHKSDERQQIAISAAVQCVGGGVEYGGDYVEGDHEVHIPEVDRDGVVEGLDHHGEEGAEVEVFTGDQELEGRDGRSGGQGDGQAGQTPAEQKGHVGGTGVGEQEIAGHHQEEGDGGESEAGADVKKLPVEVDGSAAVCMKTTETVAMIRR